MKRFAAIFAVAVMVPFVASALDTQAILAQIEALRAQIAALQSTDVSCDLPTRLLTPGKFGDHVKRLQQFLANDTTVYPEALITGYYGSLTEAAVQRWQVKYGIVTSGTPSTSGFGSVGPKTLAAMRNVWCLQAQTTPAPFTGTKNPTTTNGGVTVAPAAANIIFNSPSASTTVYQGGSLFVSWKSENSPATASVTLSLRTKTGVSIGVIKGGLSQTGTYYWAIPSPPTTSVSGTCTGDAISCVAQIAGTATDCIGPCSVPGGLYKLTADSYSGGALVAHSESRVFSVGGIGLTSEDIIGTGVYAGTGVNATSSYSQTLFTNNVSDANWMTISQPTTGGTCTYSGLPFSEGITVTVSCSDVKVPGTACGVYEGMKLTCKNGQWLNSSGVAQSVRNVTNVPTAGSCKTPWNNETVANGNQVPYAPFFTNGVYPATGVTNLMKCSGGTWQRCDTVGDHCG